MSRDSRRVLYCSTVTPALEKDSFIELVRKSVANNKEADLTGILLFDGKYFFQVLEGEQENLQPLLNRIQDDPRHTDVKILSRVPISKRLFPKWSMELIDADNDFFQETYGASFNPYEFTENEALECATNAKAWRMRRLQSA